MTQYRIREKRFSLGDDFWIETADGERAFKIDGKGSETFVLESATGDVLFSISNAESDAPGTIEITRGTQRVATITRAVVGIHHHYAVAVDGGHDLSATSNATGTELTLALGDETIANVSNHWLAMGHSFDVEIEPGQDDALILSTIVGIDWLSRE
jgi:uncharacterized protein YxjI